MSFDRLARGLARLAGAMVLVVGLTHFVMPQFGYAPETLAAIPEAQRDHFVYLGTYAIGAFLVAFGLLTLIADLNRPSRLERAFFVLMVAVWTVRLVLEIVYPVDLQLFFLVAPHVPLVAALIVILSGYGAGLVYLMGRASSRTG